MDFEQIDFEILDFIEANSPTDIETIKKRFPGIASVEYRVESMSKQKYNSTERFPLKNSSLLVQQYEYVDTDLGPHAKKTGIYEITDGGRKALQDYKREITSKRRELWLKNAWIPIIVSIATTLSINGLKQLWPLIQRWVSSFL